MSRDKELYPDEDEEEVVQESRERPYVPLDFNKDNIYPIDIEDEDDS